MIRMKSVSAIVALAILAASCSDDGSASMDTVSGTMDKPSAEATAAPQDNGPPAADDVTTLDGVAYAGLTGDAKAGKSAFIQCRTCHVIDPGMNRTGPSLAGIVGREAGSVPGFNYSAANGDSGIIWTEEKLFQFLENPQRVIPKTRMIFAGMSDAQKRADIIAYLKNPD